MSELTKAMLANGVATTAPDKLYDIRHQATASESQKLLNVIMIMMENLSADFTKTFGGKEN